MNSSEFAIVKDAVRTNGKKFAGRKFLLKFSNGQEEEFKILKSTILSSIGFKYVNLNALDDNRMKKAYDNLGNLDKKKVIKNSEDLKEILDEIDFTNIYSYLMLTFNAQNNRLELIVSDENCKDFLSLVINQESKIVERINIIDDFYSYIRDRKFVIPVSFQCKTDNKKKESRLLRNNELSKLKLIEVREAAVSFAGSTNSKFTDDEINMKKVKKKKNKSKNKKK